MLSRFSSYLLWNKCEETTSLATNMVDIVSEEQIRLVYSDIVSEEEEISGDQINRTEQIRNDKDDTLCCKRYNIFYVFYVFSVWYIIVSMLTIVVFWLTIDVYEGETKWFPVALLLSAIFRFSAAIIGFYVTNKLSNRILPSQLLIDIWTIMLLWIPIIFNTIYIIFATVLFYNYFHGQFTDPDIEIFFKVFIGEDSPTAFAGILAGFVQIPAVIDMLLCVAFYMLVNQEIEKATKRQVYGCPCFKCC
eukprot:271118_1